MRNTADVTGGKPIAIFLQSISGVSAINPLVAFYDIHGGKREVIFFYFVPDTTRDDYIDASKTTLPESVLYELPYLSESVENEVQPSELLRPLECLSL
jgi:hypothetical protein